MRAAALSRRRRSPCGWWSHARDARRATRRRFVALWVLHSDAGAREEERMLRDSAIAVGWPELGELSDHHDRERLTAAYRGAYPSVRGARLVRDVTQRHAFAFEMR